MPPRRTKNIMGQFEPQTYKAVDFSKLKGLNGISDQQIEIHLGLYQGYVTNTNKVNEEIADLLKAGRSATPEYAELNRALGFEYNGMILHEYYFGNLTPNGSGQPAAGSPISTAIQATFGSYENWVADFQAVGKMRGVGWAMLTRTRQPSGSATIGSPSTRPATPPASSHCSSWMSGSTHSWWTTSPRSALSTSRRSSATSTGMQ